MKGWLIKRTVDRNEVNTTFLLGRWNVILFCLKIQLLEWEKGWLIKRIVDINEVNTTFLLGRWNVILCCLKIQSMDLKWIGRKALRLIKRVWIGKRSARGETFKIYWPTQFKKALIRVVCCVLYERKKLYDGMKRPRLSLEINFVVAAHGWDGLAFSWCAPCQVFNKKWLRKWGRNWI